MTFIGQFYGESKHLLPKEILLPQGIDSEMIRQLLNVNVFIPQRGKKKDLVNLAIKNAQMSLKRKIPPYL